MAYLINNLPQSTYLPSQAPNYLDSPIRGSVQRSSAASTFYGSTKVPGFPSELNIPELPFAFIRPHEPGTHIVNIHVRTYNGSRWRVKINNEPPSIWYEQRTDQMVAAEGQRWNQIEIEFENERTFSDSGWKSFHLNDTTMVSGSCVLHLGRSPSNLKVGRFQLLDFHFHEVNILQYYGLSYKHISAQLLDKILIIINESITSSSSGNLNYASNPGSDDELRSEAAMAALNELIAKGVTITR